MSMSPSGGIQPLYANAPPKPRRLNSSRDQSPSPERLQEEAAGFRQMVTGQYHHPLSEVHQAHIIVDEVPTPQGYRVRPHTERRTPEAYGRMSQMRMMSQPQQPRMDYEDIYTANQRMQQQQQQQQLAMHQSAVHLAQMRTGINHGGHGGHGGRPQARPHSADFLEYDPMTSPQTPNPGGRPHSRHHHRGPQQPPRPKSSIEQRMLMDKTAFEESQIRSQSRASGVFDRVQQGNHFHHPQGPPQPLQPPIEPRVKYYPPIPSPHDSQLDLASEEVSRYFPTPSPRKSLPKQPQPPPVPMQQQQQPPQQPQMDYQNVQMPNRRQSAGEYFAGKRAESVTPMVAAASGLIDGLEPVGEFKRSSSARLHRNKRNHPEFFNLDDTKVRF